MKKAVMLFANGYEEVEALMTVDLLKRAGVDIRLVSINDEMTVTGSHGISVVMDTKLSHIQLKEEYAIITPGGMPGTMNLGVDVAVTGALKQMNRDGKIVAAICAAPSVLGKCGILEGKRATCYPGFEDKLIGAEVVEEPVVVDGNVITSRGLGTSMEFGFQLIRKLVSEEKAEEIRNQIVFMYNICNYYIKVNFLIVKLNII